MDATTKWGGGEIVISASALQSKEGSMRAITHRFSQSKTAVLAGLTSMMLALTFLLSPVAGALTIGGPSDCDNNAIIKCGVHSTAALQKAYRSDPYVQKVFTNFGISNADIADLQTTNV